MILIPHIVVGAVIGAKTHNLGLIIILGLVSHFILDMIPHWDYVDDFVDDFRKTKNLKNFIIAFLKIFSDGLVGLLIVLIAIWFYRFKNPEVINFNNLIFIIFGIFISIVPDIFLALSLVLKEKKLAKNYIKFHNGLHLLIKKEREGKPTFLNVSTEILMVIISIIMFFF